MGAFLSLVVFYPAGLAVRTSCELLKIDHLVTTGLFAAVRHPMYLGFTLWIVGWALFQGAVVGLAVGLVGIANILLWRHLEERHLEAHYGEAYRACRSRTWL